MSAINKSTGYRGFTVDGGGTYPIDASGRVKKCIVIINYTYHINDVDVTISNGNGDWAARMGDDTIIPLSNPVVLYISKDNSVVQFDMSSPYPSNSPMMLLYGSDSAEISITAINSIRPFVQNSATGLFAFTSERGVVSRIDNGNVNKLLAVFPYQNQYVDVDFSISKGESDWAARMGDGTIINLRDPEIISVDNMSASVRFTMDKSYPSNSPCVLLYRSPSAYYRVTPFCGIRPFVAVTEIAGISSNGINKIPIDLSCVEVKPYNATNKDISWSIENPACGAVIQNGILYPNSNTAIKLHASITGGQSPSSNYDKSFTISIEPNIITIEKQPNTDLIFYKGAIAETLKVFAKCVTNDIHYQWYENTTNSTANGTPITNATKSEYVVPPILSPDGNNSEKIFYYYCKITSPGAPDVYTRPTKITVRIRLLGISITPRPSSINVESFQTLGVIFNPTNAYDATQPVTWSTSNGNVLSITSAGKITGANIGKSTITVTSQSGITNSIDVNVVETFVPVTDLTGVPTEISAGTSYNISPTIIPGNATNKGISIEVLPQTTVQYTLNGTVLTCSSRGYIYLRYTIRNGYDRHQDFVRNFTIRVKDVFQFIPVSDVVLDSPSLSSPLPSGDLYVLNYTTYPLNATNRKAVFSVVSGNAIISDNVLIINGVGTIVMRATVQGGAGAGNTNYTKDFIVSGTTKFVAVNSVMFDYVEDGIHTDIIRKYTSTQDVTLPLLVNPADAMPKNYSMRVNNVQIGSIQSGQTDDYKTITSWSADNTGVCSIVNNKLHIDTDKIGFNVVYKVYIDIEIVNGIAIGQNFVTRQMISVVGRIGKGYIPVEDMNWNLPTHTRVFYPIIPIYCKPSPLYATDINNASGRFKTDEYMDADGDGFNETLKSKNFIIETSQSADDFNNHRVNIDQYIPQGQMLNQSVPPRKIFLWGIMEEYVVPQNPGKFNLKITAKSCTVNDPMNFNPETPAKIDFVRTKEIIVEDPFIGVRNIYFNHNIIYNDGGYLYICPELDTDKGMDTDNPYWDDEVPTYSDYEVAVVKTHGSLVAHAEERYLYLEKGTSGTLQLEITVPNGGQEFLRWYGLSPDEQVMNVTAYFTISVKDLSESPNPLIWISATGIAGEIPIDNMLSYMKLCDDSSPDANMIINTTSWKTYTIKKSQITKVRFGARTGSSGINLRNFGRNFTNLVSIEGLDYVIARASTLENFLRGCTRFNQPLDFSDGPTGTKAYKYCLRDCTSFNSTVRLPSSLNGVSVLHGFLYGCTSFNQTINLPSSISGMYCLKRFLYGCTSFNKPITLPTTVTGYGSMFECMAEMHSFNQNLIMPKTVNSTSATGGAGRELANFMKNCHAMCSNVTMFASPGNNAVLSPQTFSSSRKNSALTTRGITILTPTEGTANHFLDRVVNTYSVNIWPYTHYTNLDRGGG